MQLRRELGIWDLVLFNTAAVVGIRWLAAAAHIGSGSLFLWISAAALFFVPCAMAVAELARRFPEEGGIYVWTREACGEWHGFFCAWCYWLNNFFYLPSLAIAGVTMALTSFAGQAAAHRAEESGLVTVAALALLWGATAANIAGLRVGKWLGNVGGSATYLAAALLAVAGIAAWIARGPATPLEFLPRLDAEKLNFWPQIAFAFGGLELGAVLAGEIRDPERTVPRAAWWSGGAIALFYAAGTLAMLALMPAAEISAVTGLAQAGDAAGRALGSSAAAVALAVLVAAGIAGQLNTWMGGVARLPMVLGAGHYLPARFAALHPRWGSPWQALLLQAAACSFFLLAMQAGESLRTAYQLLVDMMVITYFIPFAYLFVAAWRLAGARLAAASGLAVTLIALSLSFVPPGGVASAWLFEAKLIGGTLAVLGAARWWFIRGASARRKDS